jgi:ABC-type transport system involved in multi-copper enzyme maturation permease subunit
MGLGIFYLLYNFFKTIAIVINLMTNNQFKTNNDQEIRNFESNNISDIKKSSQMNNNSVNNYQSNNQELQNSQMNYDEPNNNNQEEQEQEYPSKGEIDKNNYYGDNDGN